MDDKRPRPKRRFFSPLNQIDASTASRLGFAWQFKTDTCRGMEATPLVVDGVPYVSGIWGCVYAIDGATGVRKWVSGPHNDPSSARWSGDDVTTRGLTIWQGKVFAVATDCRPYALDARDGHIGPARTVTASLTLSSSPQNALRSVASVVLSKSCRSRGLLCASAVAGESLPFWRGFEAGWSTEARKSNHCQRGHLGK
jgi:glucose dehydrogenase